MKKVISIRGLALKYVAIMLSSVLAITLVSFLFLFEELYERQEAEHQAKAELMAENIAQFIFFYNTVVHDLAEQPQVAKLILSRSIEASEKWSMESRALLPNSNGLALLFNNSEVIGSRKKQKVGRLCMRDILLRAKGELDVMIPLHFSNGKPAHFDIVAPVMRGTEIQGALFASFALDVIQQAAERLQQKDEYIFIVAEEQLKIASIGLSQPEFSQYSASIAGTDWVLHTENQSLSFEEFLWAYLSIFLIIISIVIGLTSLFTMRLGKIVIQDILNIKEDLIAIKNGDFLQKNKVNTKLIETKEVVEQITEVANELNHYQQELLKFSFKDELTGLDNRSTFFNEYKSYQSLIKRGVKCTLVLFDLDHFKESNDTYGQSFGDEVLQSFSTILQSKIRGIDRCARLEGDEFIAIFSDCNEQEITQRYQQISEALMKRNMLWKSEHVGLSAIGVSAGAVLIKQSDRSINQSIDCADKALYQAKGLGRGRICFYAD